MAETSVQPAVRLTTICPQFVVPDAAEYYRDVFGFRILGYFLDPPVFAMVGRDTAEIHFGKADGGALLSPNVSRRSIGLDALHLGERSRCSTRTTRGVEGASCQNLLK
jgi:hypothetical protein